MRNKGPNALPIEIQQQHQEALAKGRATPEQSALVMWLYNHARESQLSNREVADLIDYDSSNISRIYSLTYSGNLSNICKKIATAKVNVEVEEERKKYGSGGFIQTTIAEAVFDVCEATRMSQQISQVWGDSQTGKSEALKRFTKKEADRTYYIELTAGLSYGSFLRFVAQRIGIKQSGTVDVIKAAIHAALDCNMLLIFDELHKILLQCGTKTKLKILDAIRDFNDKQHCGVILCGTNTLRDEFTIGNLRDYLMQMDRRGVIKCKCPDILPVRDVWKFAASYGLSQPAAKSLEGQLAKTINRTNGIGMLSKFLMAGAGYANSCSETYTWAHFVKAHDSIVKYNTDDWWK